MFLRMDINKATRFFRSHHIYVQKASQLNPESGVNFLAFKWSHYERIILSDFRRKYKIQLSIEQRWHIFLSLMEELPFPLDNSLQDFLMSGVIDAGNWAVGAKSRYALAGYPEPIDPTLALSEFPDFPLFIYSLSNSEVLYEDDKYAKNFIEHLSLLEEIRTKDELRNWYQRFWEMRESAIKDEAYPPH